LPGLDYKLLWWLLDRPASDAVMAGVLEETAARLLHAAGVLGEDVHAPFLLPSAVRPPGDPRQRQRFGPRNMACTDGLEWWELAGSFLDAGRPHWQDYSRATTDGTAVPASAIPEPSGSAVLSLEIYADDYRGAAVTFGACCATSPTSRRCPGATRSPPGRPPG
ncbi:MAG: hypothetical protein M3Y33_03015, partial [Actinomycetota bacterium]|nr:hypothetical protein [Actinomycetota bacterium]